MTRPIDEELAAAIRCHVEMEEAFGVAELPRGEACPELEAPPVTEPARAAPPRVAEPAPAAVELATDPLPDPSRRYGPKTLDTIAARIAECRDCALCDGRSRVVPGQGNPQARLMFVGEAPGYNEDQSGLAFVGKAGELLTKMIGAMGLSRDDVFIANVIKCRPPNNRDPEPSEVQACLHYLLDQIDLIRPEVICTLGGHAANNLLDRDDPMYRLRGRVFSYKDAKLVPTYHPSYLLRSPDKKGKAWEDLQVVMGLLGLGRG